MFFLKAAVAEVLERLSFPLRKRVYLKSVALSFLGVTHSVLCVCVCVKYTEITWKKEQFPKTEYYTDNISSGVNSESQKSHFISGTLCSAFFYAFHLEP